MLSQRCFLRAWNHKLTYRSYTRNRLAGDEEDLQYFIRCSPSQAAGDGGLIRCILTTTVWKESKGWKGLALAWVAGSHPTSVALWNENSTKNQNVTMRGHAGAAHLSSKAISHWKPGCTCSLQTTDSILQGLKGPWSLWPTGHWFKTQTDFVSDQKRFPPGCCLHLSKINRKVSLQFLAAHSATATFQCSTARSSVAVLHLWEQNLQSKQDSWWGHQTPALCYYVHTEPWNTSLKPA